MTLALATLALSLVPFAPAQQIPSGAHVRAQPQPCCRAEDSRLNACGDALKFGTYDFVPITADGSRGFYCVYSARQIVTPNRVVTDNVAIFVFALNPRFGRNQVLVFGCGYGDDPHALTGAALDMGLVDEIVRGCLGFSIATTTVHFLAPHGHFDHINAAAPRALAAIGYDIGSIRYHVGDQNLVLANAWTTPGHDLAPLLRPIAGGTLCGEQIDTFESPLGRLWITHRPGHTQGTIDLVIDVAHGSTSRVLVLGSSPGGACPQDVSGVQFRVLPHGNVVLNGSGECP